MLFSKRAYLEGLTLFLNDQKYRVDPLTMILGMLLDMLAPMVSMKAVWKRPAVY